MSKIKNFGRKLGRVIRIVLVSIVAFLVVSFALYHLVPSTAKTIRHFFLHLKNERYEKAYNLTDGEYKINRGSLERFSNEYKDAVLSGTRTRKVTVTSIRRADKPNQYVVSVTVRVLYRGDLMDTNGSYLLEKIPGKGWKIVQNVSSMVN